MALRLPTVDKTMPIVSVKVKVLSMTVPIEFFGISTPQYQRFVQTAAIKVDNPGGASTYSGDTAGPAYNQTKMQRLMDAVAAIYSA